MATKKTSPAPAVVQRCRVRRPRLTIDTDGDRKLQALRISNFLWNKIGGDVSEAAVLDYLSKCRDQHERAPWTKRLAPTAILRAIEAAA